MLWSLLVGEGQPANTAEWFNVMFGVGAKSGAGCRKASVLVVVGQLASSATSLTGLLFLSAWLRLAPFQSLVVVVGQLVRDAAPGSRSTPCAGPPFGPSCWHGVGHKPNPLSHVRRADTASRQTGMPNCVVDSFQVRLNKVEPTVPNRCFNLFAKDDRRAALLDEPEPVGP